MKVDLMDKVQIVQNREMTKTQIASDNQKKEREFIEKQIKQLEDFLKTQQPK